MADDEQEEKEMISEPARKTKTFKDMLQEKYIYIIYIKYNV